MRALIRIVIFSIIYITSVPIWIILDWAIKGKPIIKSTKDSHRDFKELYEITTRP